MARRRRRPRRLWIAIALVVVAAAVGGVAWRLGHEEAGSAARAGAPHEDLGEGDRRALRELLERKSGEP